MVLFSAAAVTGALGRSAQSGSFPLRRLTRRLWKNHQPMINPAQRPALPTSGALTSRSIYSSRSCAKVQSDSRFSNFCQYQPKTFQSDSLICTLNKNSAHVQCPSPCVDVMMSCHVTGDNVRCAGFSLIICLKRSATRAFFFSKYFVNSRSPPLTSS